MATMPKWAQELLLDACLAFGKEDVPDVMWRKAHRRVYQGWSRDIRVPAYTDTSGYAVPSQNRITITAGTNRLDQKRALLHELAHLLAGRGHSALFWDRAWELYRWAEMPVRVIARREGAYRKGALLAYARSRKSKEVKHDAY